MAGLWLVSQPNDPSKMVQTVFQPTRKKSAGVGTFWWKHPGGLLYDFLVISGCAIRNSGEETLWHNRRTCPDSGLHCGIGSHCLTDSCRKNEEEEEEAAALFSLPFFCRVWSVWVGLFLFQWKHGLSVGR